MSVPPQSAAANLRANLKAEGIKTALRGGDISPELPAHLTQATKESGLTRAVTRGSVGRTDISALTKQISIMSANLFRADKDAVALANVLRANKAYEGIRSVIRASGANVPEHINKYMRSMQGRLGVMTGGKDPTDLLAKIAQSSEASKKDLDRVVRSGGSRAGGMNPFLFTRLAAQATGSKTLANAPQIHNTSVGMLGMGKGGIIGTVAALAAGLLIESPGLLLDSAQSLQNRYKTYGNYLNQSAQVARFGGMGAYTNLNALGPNALTRGSMSNMALQAISPQYANPNTFMQTAGLSNVALRNPKEMANFVSAVAQAQASSKNIGGFSSEQYAGAFGQLQTYGMANRGGNVVSPNALTQFANVYGRVMEKSVTLGVDKAKVFEAMQQGIDVMARGGGAMYKSMPGTMMGAFMSQGSMFPSLRNPAQAISTMQGIQSANQNVMSNPALGIANMSFVQSRKGKTFRDKFATLGPAARAILHRHPNAGDAMLMKLGSEAGVFDPYAGLVMQNLLGGSVPKGAGFMTSGVENIYGAKYAAAQQVAGRKTPYLGGSGGPGAAPGIAVGKLMTSGAKSVLWHYQQLLRTDPAAAASFKGKILQSAGKKGPMGEAAAALNYALQNQLISNTGNFTHKMGGGTWLHPKPINLGINGLTGQGKQMANELTAMISHPFDAVTQKGYSFNGAQPANQVNPPDMQAIGNQLTQLNDALIASSTNWLNGANRISDTLTRWANAVQTKISGHTVSNAPKTRNR